VYTQETIVHGPLKKDPGAMSLSYIPDDVLSTEPDDEIPERMQPLDAQGNRKLVLRLMAVKVVRACFKQFAEQHLEGAFEDEQLWELAKKLQEDLFGFSLSKPQVYLCLCRTYACCLWVCLSALSVACASHHHGRDLSFLSSDNSSPVWSYQAAAWAFPEREITDDVYKYYQLLSHGSLQEHQRESSDFVSFLCCAGPASFPGEDVLGHNGLFQLGITDLGEGAPEGYEVRGRACVS
jgi:hypothetical protein